MFYFSVCLERMKHLNGVRRRFVFYHGRNAGNDIRIEF